MRLLPLLVITACAKTAPPASPAPTTPRHDALSRETFNRLAVLHNLPLYWTVDADGDATVDPDEVDALLFYPTTGAWVERGVFTPAFEAAYARMVADHERPPTLDDRQTLVAQDLDGGRATLVRSDLRGLSPDEKSFVQHLLTAAAKIDTLYDLTTGAAALADQVPATDVPSQSLFRRNRGPRCAVPGTESNPACSAIPGAPVPLVDVYPAALQAKEGFCAELEARPDAATLLAPFAVVRADAAGALSAVPYHVAYAAYVGPIAAELQAAAAAIGRVPGEAALVAYLNAAADGFLSDAWQPADEAWSRMNPQNSKWYVRVGPDETYWEPCAQKAGFHLTLARINLTSLEWQDKLTPLQQSMEHTIAAVAGPPYTERTVTFHLPDFIDIVVNAGDDRDPISGTVGQSLPNWGPVADEGRGRTVAMSNLFVDPDSLAAVRAQASSILAAEAMSVYTDDDLPGLLSTILHEATHNLGPSADYRVGGKNDAQVFGGQLAAMLEELKAQTGGLFLVEHLRKQGQLSDPLARQVYLDSVVWALGHVAKGMYTPDGKRKAYSQLAAVQLGILMDEGALSWNPDEKAANGTDQGAFVVHEDKLVLAIDAMMKQVAGIKARGNRAAAEALCRRYVDGPLLPQATIAERYLRTPKASLVYAVEM